MTTNALPTPDYMRFSRFRNEVPAIDDAVRVEAFNLFIKAFHARYRDILTDPRPNYDVRIGAGDEVLRALQVDGVALAKSDPGLKAELNALAQPLANGIEAHLAGLEETNFKDTQILLKPEEHADLYKAIEAVLDEAHVSDAAAAYAGRPLKVTGVAVQVNTPATTLRKYKAVGDDGLPLKKTHYMHIDSSGWPHSKVLMYLDRVGLDQGPFRFVAGSHRLADDFELAVRKTNDKLRIAPKLFMALPDQFRLLADFGDHMDPDSAQSQAFLDKEKALYDEQGSDLVLFDYHGVHRGAFVREGRRAILQINFVGRD